MPLISECKERKIPYESKERNQEDISFGKNTPTNKGYNIPFSSQAHSKSTKTHPIMGGGIFLSPLEVKMTPRNRPVLIYDGDCNFCRRWVARLCYVTGDRIDTQAFQEVAHQFPDISPDQFQASIQLVQPDGSVLDGAEAVFLALAYNPNYGRPLWVYRKVPGVASVTEFLYRLVARNRRVIGRL